VKRIAFLFVLVVTAAAGCGGGGEPLAKPDYQREVRQVGDTLGKAIRGLGTAGANTDLKAAAGEIEKLQGALRSAADDLDGLEPPREIEPAHEELVDGIRGFAGELDELRDASAAGDAARIRAFEAGFAKSEAVKKIRHASAELEKKGYKIE
jgi:hypothetical protein